MIRSNRIESWSSFSLEHGLFGKPASTFPDHALKRKRRGCPRRLLLLIRRFGVGHQPRLISGGGAIIGTMSGCSLQRRPILKSQALVLSRLKEAPGQNAVFWQATTAVCGEPRCR